jgi:hypothetical protein
MRAVGRWHLHGPIGKIEEDTRLALKVKLQIDLVLVLLHCGNAQLRPLRSGRYSDAILLAIETVVGLIGRRIAIAQVKIALQ